MPNRTIRYTLLGLLSFALTSPAGAQSICSLTLELVDAESNAAVPGLFRILDARGEAVAVESELLNRGLGLNDAAIRRWLVHTETSTVRVPAAELTVEAFSGLETEHTRVTIDLSGRTEARARIPLRRFYDAGAKGFRNANTHLHLRRFHRELADRYLREIPQADGLEIVFLSYLERAGDDRDYISNGYTPDDLERLSASGVLFAWGQEHRHNFSAYDEGYGHAMLLELGRLVQPVSIGPGIMQTGTDGLPIQHGIDTARRDGATIIWCHNNWGYEDIPNWITGRLHAQNIFDGGTHGSYRHSFYRYLNAGLRVPFSTGTDWFLYDFSRVYVQLDGALTTKAWREALAAGKSYITNGPFLEFAVNGQAAGAVVSLGRPGAVTVEARALGRVDFGTIELLQNGRVVESVETQPRDKHFVAELRSRLELSGPCWLALRTPPPPVPDDPELQTAVPFNEFGGALFAHTSPVYVEMAGHAYMDRVVATALLEEMQENLRVIGQKALYANDGERQVVRRVYEEAMETLRDKLK